MRQTLLEPPVDESGLAPPRFGVEGRVVAIEPLSPSVTAVRVRVEGKPLAFAPGQYVALTLPEQQPRDYSLTWRSQPDELEFFVRNHGAGGTSSYAAERLRIADLVHFDGPFGTMTPGVHDPSDYAPILCIASSTGIGPIAALVEVIGDLAPERELHLYWGAAEANDLFLLNELSGLMPLEGRLVLSAEDAEPDDTIVRHGTPLDAIAADIESLHGWTAFAAGPPVMVEAAAVLLQSLGLAPEALHADAFFTQKDKQSPHGS
jgi:ferredoxin-NAD(P)+ reductase (naphthalene dioxygenase ferredoxin-specific)